MYRTLDIDIDIVSNHQYRILGKSKDNSLLLINFLEQSHFKIIRRKKKKPYSWNLPPRVTLKRIKYLLSRDGGGVESFGRKWNSHQLALRLVLCGHAVSSPKIFI